MKCWSCLAELPNPEFGKLSFRAECEKCGVALHCCRNCKYYHPGKPNDCEVPGTDYIADRTKINLCEEFKLKSQTSTSSAPSLADIENKLFGTTNNSNEQDPKDKFNPSLKISQENQKTSCKG